VCGWALMLFSVLWSSHPPCKCAWGNPSTCSRRVGVWLAWEDEETMEGSRNLVHPNALIISFFAPPPSFPLSFLPTTTFTTTARCFLPKKLGSGRTNFLVVLNLIQGMWWGEKEGRRGGGRQRSGIRRGAE